MDTIKQSFRDRVAHPQHLVVEFIILVAAGYNFTVTARFQGWESADPTVKAGAVVFALIVDGGLFASLFLMRDALYREREQRAKKWRRWAILFGSISCLMALLFNGSHWQPDTVSAASWVGSLLGLLESSGAALLLKSVVPIIALYPLAIYAPAKPQSLEEVKTESEKELIREETRTRIEELKRQRDPRAAERERQERKRRILIRLRAELKKAEVPRVDRMADDAVLIEATRLGIYDPDTDAVKEYQPKPMPPFQRILEIALEQGMVEQEFWEDEAQYYKGEARKEFEADIRRRVEEAGLTPAVPAQPEVTVPAGTGDAEETATDSAPSPIEEVAGQGVASGQTDPRMRAQGAPFAADVPWRDICNIPRKRQYNLNEAAQICGIAPTTFSYWVKRMKRFQATRPRGGTPYFKYEQMVATFAETAPERAARAQQLAILKGYQTTLAPNPVSDPPGDQQDDPQLNGTTGEIVGGN